MSDAADDAFQLSRFVTAQQHTYAQALAELRRGQKESHWMWFIFPQLRGLGTSAMADRYAIGSIAEAVAFFGHPVLGPRFLACCEALLQVNGRTAGDIFGCPDELKLRSSLTLFVQVEQSRAICEAVLAKYFAGRPDERTLALLRAMGKQA